MKRYYRIPILLCVVLIVLGVIGLVYYFNNKHGNQPGTNGGQEATSQPVKKPLSYANSRTDFRNDTGSIWAGYIAKNQTFTKVEGKTIVPHITCTEASDVYSAWVGFDGSRGEPNVEQVGFTASCMPIAGHKTNQYGVDMYAWWMMFGAGSADLFTFNIKEGDTIYYSVAYEKGQYIMAVQNITTGQQESHSAACEQSNNYNFDGTLNPVRCSQNTVEWIVERSGNGNLAKFDTARLFANTATVADGTTHPIGYFDNELWNMSDSDGGKLTNVSDLSPDDTFSVEWLSRGNIVRK